MRTSRLVNTFWLLALAWLPVLLQLATLILGFSYVQLKFNKARAAILGDLVQLQAERARVAGTIGAAVRRGVIPSAQAATPTAALGPAVASALAQGAVEGQEVEVPDWLVNTLKGAGIDTQKLLNGDPATLQRMKAVLEGIKQDSQGAQPGAPPAGNGPINWA